jgi:hypothetical protein
MYAHSRTVVDVAERVLPSVASLRVSGPRGQGLVEFGDVGRG